jgi:polyferredoxin
MKQIRLKTIRLLLAVTYTFFLAFIFLDFKEVIPTGVIKGLTFLQFLPSLIKFVTVLGLSASGLFIIILISALFGRVYCSVICPLGVFQDFTSRIRKWTKKKQHRYRYHRPQHLLRYFFLGLVLILFIAGSMIGVSMLDPYSIFGRMVSDLFQPIYIWGNNRIAGIMESMHIYALYPEDIIAARWQTYLIPAGMLGIVVWLSFTRGRLYCNTVCPVGTLLGLISRISLFRIRMIEERCTKCAKCAFECKAECIRVKDLQVDFSRCVACYNCIKVCPEDAIKYRYVPAWKSPQPISEKQGSVEVTGAEAAAVSGGRREAITRIFGLGLVFMGLRSRTFANSFKQEEVPSSVKEGDTETASIENKIPTKIEPVKHFPVSPPGSLGLRHFTNRCTACNLCVSSCPTDVLQPSLLEYGWSGLMQPHMDYSTNYCNFDCVICSEVCPTGAILSLTAEAKKTVQLGQVQLILENCVVYAEHTACGSCSEHCPTQAVTMVPYINNLTLPEIIPEICVGCGACEYACPVKPFKAIYVDGHEIHQVAEEPKAEALEQPDLEEEFPF